MTSEPTFVVVGHPNKGKSSLVATLARDTSVAIGPEPGTTTRSRRYPMRVGGEVIYTLVDTPGFQRARAALDWMRQREGDAASRAGVVTRFVKEHAGEPRFADECELLGPIVEGAGLIYVVDGAAPYGPEYEAEMEILRWTGRPSMAIINPIGSPRFVEEWRAALEQFFRVVRVLDVLAAPFARQIDLLRTFGELREEWRAPLERGVAALIDNRRRQRKDAAQVVAEMIANALSHSETLDVEQEDDPARHEAALQERYCAGLRKLERRARAEVEVIYGYPDLERREHEMELLEADLLSQESWIAFGLRKRDLVAAGMVSGAVAGGAIDVAMAGSSLLLGAALGSVVGGALGFFTSDQMASIRVLRQPLGGKRLRFGPTKNVQFPFVLLGRARLHHTLIAGRTHAQRTALMVEAAGPVASLDDDARRALLRIFERLRRTEPGTAERGAAVTQLAERIGALPEWSEDSRGQDR